MTQYLKYNDPLHIVFRMGTEDDPFVPKTTTQKIINNIIVLDEIPDEFSHVVIPNYAEIFKGEPTSMQFKVNYQNGIVTFNQSEEGKTITASYMGRAVILYPAERIYTHSDDPNVVKTLQKIIDDGEEAINAVGGLQGKIDEADILKTDLGTLVTNGTTLNTNLQNNISDGNEINDTLEILTIPNANDIKGELEGVIDSAGTVKTNLDGSITTGNTLKSDLNGLISDGGTLKTDLGTLVTNGTTLKSDLSGQISEGNTLIPDLNTAVTTANTAKGQLDGTIESANTSIDELNAYAFIEGYNSNTDYVPLNKTVYNGSTYQNIVACKGVLPTNTTHWILVSAKGVDGSGTTVTPSETNGNVILNGVETTVYAHPGSGTNPHGTTKEDIGLGDVENKSSATIIGEITKEDITALGIPAQDTVYTHPNNHPASMITEDETHRLVTDAEKMAWNSAESNAKTYADNNFEQMDSNIMRKNVAQTMTANLTANGGTDYDTSKVRNIIAIEEGAPEPPVENGALLVVYEAVSS